MNATRIVSQPDPPKLLYTPDAFEEGKTVVQFRDNELVLTDMGGRPIDDQQTKIIANARRQQYSGTMTRQAQKRMTRAITLLSQVSKAKWITNPVTGRVQYFKLSLITLTISSHTNICAKTAYKKLLSPMLSWLRYTVGCRHYVWKAELQKRGQLHYHIMVPKFIHYRQLRDKWNKLQSDNGYLRDYVAATKKLDPNSTDIVSVGNEKNVSKYLLKYLSKNEDQQLFVKKLNAERDYNRGDITREELDAVLKFVYDNTAKLDGKLWDCSEALNEKYFTVLLKWKLGIVLAEYIKNNPGCAFYGERFCCIQINFEDPPDFMQFVMARYRMYLDYIRAGGSKAMEK